MPRTPPQRIPLTTPEEGRDRHWDVLVVGAGAAGLVAALAARGVLGADGKSLPLRSEAPAVALLNNETRIGLKILVSGGGRCNLTNAEVDEGDFDSDAPHLVRRLLRGFPPASIRSFFESHGCALYEEELGKVFPESDDAKEVLRVLLDEIARARIPLIAPAEVSDIRSGEQGMQIQLADGSLWSAEQVILASGGKSLPKTGSRGFGLELLERLGHDLEPALPALTPLLLGRTSALHGLAGLTVPAVLTLAPLGTTADQISGKRFRPLARSAGSLLVTHKGATGPAPFDVSGACGRALQDGGRALLSGDFWSLTQSDSAWAPYLELAKPPGASLRPGEAPRPPGREEFASQMKPLLSARERGLGQALSERLPRSLVQALLRARGFEPSQPIKRLDKRDLAQLWLALTQAELQLEGCEGYAKAEVTTGGVRLAELVPASLESRRQPRLYCCGEVVNVTGRLGGFNFQWAWSSGFAAGRGAAKVLEGDI